MRASKGYTLVELLIGSMVVAALKAVWQFILN